MNTIPSPNRRRVLGDEMTWLKDFARSFVPAPAMIFYRAHTAYAKYHGVRPNILFPSTFSEKLHFRKLFDRRKILPTLVDKVAVRSFVAERIDSKYLPKIYFVGDCDNIPFSDLPEKYAIKPTHGSGWVHIVDGRTPPDPRKIRTMAKKWLRMNYFYVDYEWPYKSVKPQILVEEYLGDGSGAPPTDYKFFVFSGEIAMIQVDLDRFSHHSRAVFDENWQRLAVRYHFDTPTKEIARPRNLSEMTSVAKRLAAEFDFMRVDLYDLGDRVVFGEITPTPGSGMTHIAPYEFDYHLGQRWRQQRPWWLPGRGFSRWN
jgi:hypothetical protein